jgi:hypothetical protein
VNIHPLTPIWVETTKNLARCSAVTGNGDGDMVPVCGNNVVADISNTTATISPTDLVDTTTISSSELHIHTRHIEDSIEKTVNWKLGQPVYVTPLSV